MSEHNRADHKQVNAMPEGPQKDLAVYMHMYSHFPEEPIFDNPTYNDELVRLTYDAGGSFYHKDARLMFHQMSVLELDNWWVDDHCKDPEYEKLIDPDTRIYRSTNNAERPLFYW
jgi:hypothetical protein